MKVTRSTLQSLAGWAIANTGAGGPHDEALLKLRDGCEAAMEFVADSVAPAPTSAPVHLPAAVRPAATDETCQHRFDIRTQCCVFCARSYRDVKNCEPEFMGKRG